MNNSNQDVKAVYKQFTIWFRKKNSLQKIVWFVYFIVNFYEFFATRTKYQLFEVLLVSTILVVIIDWIFSKNNKQS